MRPVSVLGFAMLLASASVQAGQYTGYLCQVSYNPNASSIVGNFGAVHFSIYTGERCSGPRLFSSSLYSTGATSPLASANRYTEAGLMATFNNLVGALQQRTKVSVQTSGIGASEHPWYIQFRQD